MTTETTGAGGRDWLVDLGISASKDALAIYRRALATGLVNAMQVQASRDIVRLSCGRDTAATHAMLAAMWSCTNQGSLCLPVEREVLRREFAALVGGRGVSVGSVGSVGSGGDSGGDETTVDVDGLVELALEQIGAGDPLFCNPGGFVPWPVRIVRDRLYFDRMYIREAHLEVMLKRLRDAQDAPLFVDDPEHSRLRRIVDEVSVAQIPSIGPDGRPASRAVSLNAAQKLAVMLAMLRRFVVVSGGPGTGKTRILASLLRAWAMAGVDPAHILLVAPTGRAGKRMGESIVKAFGEAPGFDDEPWAGQLRGMTGMTIHRALSPVPHTGRWKYNAEKRLPYRVVVCDEVSMVDVALMDDLISVLPDDARVVFMGDRDQLPSVESGAVLGDIIPRRMVDGRVADFVPAFTPETIATATAACILPCGDPADERHETGVGPMADSVVILQKSYRTRGNVTAVARLVNKADRAAFEAAGRMTPDALSTPDAFDDGEFVCRVVEGVQGNRGALQSIVGAWLEWLYRDVRGLVPGAAAADDVRELFRRLAAVRFGNVRAPDDIALLDALFGTLDRGRILCVLRDGPFGASGVNRVAAGMAGTSDIFFPGCPIMVTRNLNSERLFNGETGIVMRDASGSLAAIFRQQDGYRSFPLSALGSCLPAFAGTVHKSQGSEYRNVVVVLPDQPDHPLMTREILYTAMTRSSNNVWMVGSPDVLRAAIGRGTSRYSGLDLWS